MCVACKLLLITRVHFGVVIVHQLKTSVQIVLGFVFLAIGLVFILLPGPAVIFIPLGLALLSLHFSWAKKWLKQSQYWMRQSAQRVDAWLLKRK